MHPLPNHERPPEPCPDAPRPARSASSCWAPPPPPAPSAWSGSAASPRRTRSSCGPCRRRRASTATGGTARAARTTAAYEKVGLIGRRLLRAQGRRDLLLAPAIRPTLDSLGFVTEVATDPASPTFALLMVRDPEHPAAEAVGYLYWFRENDLRMQGVLFRGGRRPRMRVWWTGKADRPYEWGVVDETAARGQRFTLLRLRAERRALGHPAGRGALPDAGRGGGGAVGGPERRRAPRAGRLGAVRDRLAVRRVRRLPAPRHRAHLHRGSRDLRAAGRAAAAHALRHAGAVRAAAARRAAGPGGEAGARPGEGARGGGAGLEPARGAHAVAGGVRRAGRGLAAPARAALRGPAGREALRRRLRAARRPLDHRELVRAAAARAPLPVRGRAAGPSRPAGRRRPRRRGRARRPRGRGERAGARAGPGSWRTAPAPCWPRSLVALGALAGCSREPRFVPASADSALAGGQDAFAEQARVAQQQWADGGPEAARASAGLLLADLRARSGGRPRRRLGGARAGVARLARHRRRVRRGAGGAGGQLLLAQRPVGGLVAVAVLGRRRHGPGAGGRGARDGPRRAGLARPVRRTAADRRGDGRRPRDRGALQPARRRRVAAVRHDLVRRGGARAGADARARLAGRRRQRRVRDRARRRDVPGDADLAADAALRRVLDLPARRARAPLPLGARGLPPRRGPRRRLALRRLRGPRPRARRRRPRRPRCAA